LTTLNTKSIMNKLQKAKIQMSNQNNLFPQPDQPLENTNGYIPRVEDPSLKLNKLAETAQKLSDTDNIQTPPQTLTQPQPYNNQVYQQPIQPVYNPQSYPPQSPNQNYYPQTNNYQQNQIPQPPYQNSEQVNYQNYDYSNSDFSTGLVDPNAPAPIETQKPKTSFDFKQIIVKFWKIPAIILLILILTCGGFLAYTKLNTKVNDPTKFLNISANIEAPKSLSQGTPGTWNLFINNNEETKIENIEVELEYDDNFQFVKGINQQPENLTGNLFKIAKLDEVNSGESQVVISIQGLVTGQVDLTSVMQGRISYTPTIINKELDSQRLVDIPAVKTKITSPEIKVTLDAETSSIQNGGDQTFTIKIKNTKQTDYQDLKLRMNYPAGNTFTYISSEFSNDSNGSSSDTPDDGDDTWLISRLPGLSEQVLILKGRINVKSQQKISFGVDLSLKTDKTNYQTITKVFKDISVASETLSLNTYIEKDDRTFVPGEKLKFVINYENKSQTVIKNAEILASIEDKSNLLDLKTISFIGGNRPYEINNQIQWTGNNTPQLVTVGPTATGRIEYEVEVKKDVIREKLSQGDYVIKPNVSMKAINLQDVYASGELYKMRSNFGFVATTPIEVNIAKSTNTNRRKYRMSWSLNNEQSQTDDIVVRSSTKLPPATWQSTIISPSEQAKNFSYNPSNGEIVWKVNKLEPFTGNEGKDQVVINFEIIIELQNQNGLVILEAPTVSAKDNFTGSIFNLSGQESKIGN
jgi:hypothetical protein